MSDTDVLSEAPSSTLSTALGTAVLEASPYATDGNTESFTTTSDNSQYIKQGRMVYLLVDHTTNLKKGTAPSWIWDHREELRHLAGYRPQRTGAVVTAVLQSGQLFLSVVLPSARASIFRKKHKVYKPGSELDSPYRNELDPMELYNTCKASPLYSVYHHPNRESRLRRSD